MAEHNELGKLGKLAVEFLQKEHYFSYKLDFSKAEWILLLKRNNLAVIEVKTRSSLEFGLPQDFVKPKKYNFLPRQLTPM
jgi:putative endonuclease